MHNYTDDVITEGPKSPENKGCVALQKQTLTNHLKLSGPLLSTSAAQRGCFFHLTGEKMRWCSFDTAWKNKKHKNLWSASAKFTRNVNPESWLELSRGQEGRTRKTSVWPPVTWQEGEEEDEEEEGDGAWLESKDCFYCPFVRKPVILHNKLT